MTRTVAYYNFEGTSKAKTANAILFQNEATGMETWLPTRVVSVRFIGPNYRVRVSIPDWLSCKLDWKEPVVKPKNPYIGADVGNMMEERMVMNEQLDYIAKGTPEYIALVNRIRLIDEAAALV
jgi:hypothetical protein